MAVKKGVNPVSFVASADLSAKQFLAVKISGDDTVTVVSAVTDIVIGILQNNPASGKAAEVDIDGITKWTAAGTVTAGQRVGVSSGGKCTPVGSGVPAHGIVTKGCGANEYAEVLLCLGGYAA